MLLQSRFVGYRVRDLNTGGNGMIGQKIHRRSLQKNRTL